MTRRRSAGLIGQAAQVAGPDLWAAVVTAKARIAAAGGTATHLAADPDVIGAEESRTDEDGRPLWPDGLASFAGVTVVPTAGATEPLLYDRTRVVLVVRTDYEALLSEDYAPAFERYAIALRRDPVTSDIDRLRAAHPLRRRSPPRHYWPGCPAPAFCGWR